MDIICTLSEYLFREDAVPDKNGIEVAESGEIIATGSFPYSYRICPVCKRLIMPCTMFMKEMVLWQAPRSMWT